MESVYGYFANSNSRQARLKEMHAILDTDDVKLKCIHTPTGKSTMDTLRDMQGEEEGGTKFQEFRYSLVVNNGNTYFKGEKIRSTRQMRLAVDGMRQHLVNNLIDNMNYRLPDIGLFKAFRILDRKSLP
ncbi:Hypp708 [Branchiostoma lanceolatum]|uniref:Hypp708 protein n=1 Tax=Branchiostoma lanceolatum TaxID=7740 RepID=A0A8J9VBD4_BRALA|nr:Hypp708 [Branchiostoma lanceolatum]